jgi:ectoine hydroxylase-related dioxygenase (phytanoyl-CoA dioxygenase family)
MPIEGLLRRVTYPYLVSPIFNELRWHKPLRLILEGILGGTVAQIVNQVNFNHPGRGTGWGWHQDYRFRRPGISQMAKHFVQSLVAIDPCNELTGGLRLIPFSHRIGAIQLDRFGELSHRYFSETEAVTAILQPGDVAFFGPYCVHGSTRNQSANQRRVYINGFARASALNGAHGQLEGSSSPMEYEEQRDKLPASSKY